MLCCLVFTDYSKERHAIVFSGVSWTSQPLKRKAIRSSETSGETNTVIQCHIPNINRTVLFEPRRVTNPTTFKSLSANQISSLRISLRLSRSFRASLPSHVTAIWLRIWTSCLLQPEVACVPTICICRLSDSKLSPFRHHTSRNMTSEAETINIIKIITTRSSDGRITLQQTVQGEELIPSDRGALLWARSRTIGFLKLRGIYMVKWLSFWRGNVSAQLSHYRHSVGSPLTDHPTSC